MGLNMIWSLIAVKTGLQTQKPAGDRQGTGRHGEVNRSRTGMMGAKLKGTEHGLSKKSRGSHPESYVKSWF